MTLAERIATAPRVGDEITLLGGQVAYRVVDLDGPLVGCFRSEARRDGPERVSEQYLQRGAWADFVRVAGSWRESG